jgi:succinylarginine dihydrolase
MREVQFDGLVGPTHNYGALSPGNVASEAHGGETSNPRAAALEGLAKMRLVRGLGVVQAVLPPHERPSLSALRLLGFRGSDEEIIAAAASSASSGASGNLLLSSSSASAMWTANAATVAPSSDSADGRVHLVVANLRQMFHRAIEAEETARILRAVFRDPRRFVVHDPLPDRGEDLADEGAANHLRLQTPATSGGSAHVFAWGRRARGTFEGPKRHPARQTFEASEALARLHQLDPRRVLFPQQHPEGIDAGAFHTDVLAVGNENFLMLHELAFADCERLELDLRALLGERLVVVRSSSSELPIERAVASYVFNSQVLTLPGGAMTVVAPVDARDDEHASRFLDRVLASGGPVRSVHYVDVRQSMRNGGGPACLRLRVPLTDEEIGALEGRVIVDDALDAALVAWVERHYRDRLTPGDLADPALAREGMSALEELSSLLGMGEVYDFQRER